MGNKKNIIIVPLFDTLENINQTKVSFPMINEGEAKNDYQISRYFLHEYRGSHATFNSYRREIERLLQWSWLIKSSSITLLKSADIEAFIEFCQSPPKEWIGTQTLSRFIDQEGVRLPNPDWRPFVATVSKKAFREGQSPDIAHYSLSNKAVQAIFSVLSSFYNYLIQEGRMDANPVAQMRQKNKYLRKRQQNTVVRRLSELQWIYVIETAELMAAESPNHERTLFIMNALYGMYLRISELTANNNWEPQMGHFFRDADNNWWFKTVGKGNKERDISVSDAMLDALKRYRASLGLSLLPSPGDADPLIPKITGKGPVKDTRQIRHLVQECFDRAIERLNEDGFKDESETLLTATVHWLRHTGISDDVKIRPREHVRDDAGHSSSMITDRYIDVESRERHASAKKKLIKKD